MNLYSQLYIYNISDWSVGDNYAIDDIENYLATLTPVYSNVQFQYIRPALSVKIKIGLDVNDDDDVIQFNNHGGYVKITEPNTTTTSLIETFYYYVMNVRYVAPKTVELELGLDTINTYLDDIKTQLSENDRHLIHRQHKDRFMNTTGSRLIDRYPEEFTPSLMPTSAPTTITNMNDPQDREWYLVYKTNQASPTAVSCYAYCKPHALKYASSNSSLIVWHPGDLIQGQYYYLFAEPDCATPGVRTGSTGGTHVSENNPLIRIDYNTSVNQIRVVVIHRDGTNTSLGSTENLTFLNTRRIYRYGYSTTQINEIQEFGTSMALVSGNITAQYVGTLDEIDRTDPNIIKIIQLAYAPFTPSFSSNTINTPTGWVYDVKNQAFRLDVNDQEFVDNITTISVNNALANMIYTLNPSKNEPRRDWTVESKLYNSQFRDIRFLYDTNSWSFRPELFYWSGNTGVAPYLNVRFKPSNGMNSAFGFQFYTSPAHEYRDNADYPGYLIANRNNEVPIYTSEYLNYLKYGKEYDIQQQKQNLLTNAFNIGANVVGGIVGGFAVGNVVGAVVGGVAGAVNGIANLAANSLQTIRAQQQKEFELKNQATSVSGNNDFDLFKWYNGNRLVYNIYSPTTVMRNMIYDYFYYFGYADNSYDTINYDSRLWWNYVQADIIYQNQSMQQEFVEDIKTRFKIGVTFMHRNDNTYDWARDRENWETKLLLGEFNTTVQVTQTPSDEQYDITGQLIKYVNGDVVDFEWYWNLNNWNNKNPDETTIVTPSSDGSFSENNNMQGGIAIRARVRNGITGDVYPWHTIWEAEE